MPSCTPEFYWQPVLTYVLPAVGALLSAIAALVAAHARGISRDAQSTSQAAVSLSLLGSESSADNASRRTAPGRSKQSTRETISTSRGDELQDDADDERWGPDDWRPPGVS